MSKDAELLSFVYLWTKGEKGCNTTLHADHCLLQRKSPITKERRAEVTDLVLKAVNFLFKDESIANMSLVSFLLSVLLQTRHWVDFPPIT